jgi:hypothetical protein
MTSLSKKFFLALVIFTAGFLIGSFLAPNLSQNYPVELAIENESLLFLYTNSLIIPLSAFYRTGLYSV